MLAPDLASVSALALASASALALAAALSRKLYLPISYPIELDEDNGSTDWLSKRTRALSILCRLKYFCQLHFRAVSSLWIEDKSEGWESRSCRTARKTKKTKVYNHQKYLKENIKPRCSSGQATDRLPSGFQRVFTNFMHSASSDISEIGT